MQRVIDFFSLKSFELSKDQRGAGFFVELDLCELVNGKNQVVYDIISNAVPIIFSRTFKKINICKKSRRESSRLRLCSYLQYLSIIGTH
jgi:hypothetical protein